MTANKPDHAGSDLPAELPAELPADLQALLNPSQTVLFGGAPLAVEELNVKQTLQLIAMQDQLAGLDWANLAALAKHSPAVLERVLCIALAVDAERIGRAKLSELQAAVSALLGLNKAFFLEALRMLTAGAALASEVRAKMAATAMAKEQTSAPAPQPTPAQPAPAGPTPLPG